MLMIFRTRPTQPMIRTSLGFSTRSMVMKRSIDWRAILRPKARRNAPLKKAPRSDARAQPKERS
jgi:hypothetical protein